MKEATILLKDLQDLFLQKHKYFVSAGQGHQGIPKGTYEGSQGEYNETFKFYRHPALPEGIFMRETYQTDSYGSGCSLVSISFVEGKQKTVTVFEPI